MSDMFPFCHPCGKQPGDCQIQADSPVDSVQVPQINAFVSHAAVGGLGIPDNHLPSLEPYGGIQKMQAGIFPAFPHS